MASSPVGPPLRPPNLNIERGGGGASFRPSRSCPGASATVLEQHSSDGAGHRPQSGKSRTPRNQKFGESPGTRGWVSQARRPKPPLGAPKPLGPSLGGQAARPRRATTRPLKLFFFFFEYPSRPPLLSNRGVSPPRPPPPREPFRKGVQSLDRVQSEAHSSPAELRRRLRPEVRGGRVGQKGERKGEMKRGPRRGEKAKREEGRELGEALTHERHKRKTKTTLMRRELGEES